MIKSNKFFLLLLCLFSFAFFTHVAQASSISVPQIVNVTENETYGFARPVVAGVVAANNEVLVYIDGALFGVAKIQNKNQSVANFYYRTAVNFPAGEHHIQVAARSLTDNVVSPLSQEVKFVVPQLTAPTVVNPSENIFLVNKAVVIKGLTQSGNIIQIYIDEAYSGTVVAGKSVSGVAGFSYQTQELNYGYHSVKTVAQDAQGAKNATSTSVIFRVAMHQPAPTIVKAIANRADVARPFIVGLAKNDSSLDVYIDGKFDGFFKVTNDKSGTANFAYQPKKGLIQGSHKIIFALHGISRSDDTVSGVFYFNVVGKVKIPAIASGVKINKVVKTGNGIVITVAENNVKTKKSITVKKDNNKAIVPKIDQKVSVAKNISTTTKANIDKGDKQKNVVTEGLINEKKQQQSSVKPGSIIFILFVLGFIGWIVWVNKEIIKEKRNNEVEVKNEELKNNQENKK